MRFLPCGGKRRQGARQRRRGQHGQLCRRRGRRRACATDKHEEQDTTEQTEGPPHGRRSRFDGISTITLVALTTQTASSPTFRSSSSTASAVIKLTNRCGPAWTSTTAATRSLSTRVI